jgi:MFS family permease
VRLSISLLALCQAIAQSGNIHLTTTGALIGLALTGSDTMSTWPASMSVSVALLVTIPASILMGRYGRKTGFLLGYAVGIAGAGIAALSVLQNNFPLFMLGTALMGVLVGFAGYFRFAAVELVDVSWRSKAISFVLAGGVIAAFLGPSLSKWGLNLIAGAPFAGGFVLWLPLAVLAAAIIARLRFPMPTKRDISLVASLRHLLKHSPLLSLILLGAGAYVIMAMIMTATPLAMHHHHMGFEATTQVIRSHMLGMFVPSFFTGHLIKFFGVRTIVVTGGLLYALCIAINFMGTGSGSASTALGSAWGTYWQFMSSLILLGVGWNFLFVSASQLLVSNIAPEHQTAAQALNDFFIAAGIAFSIAFTGKLHETLGWKWLNAATIPLVLMVVFTGAFRLKRQSNARVGT